MVRGTLAHLADPASGLWQQPQARGLFSTAGPETPLCVSKIALERASVLQRALS